MMPRSPFTDAMGLLLLLPFALAAAGCASLDKPYPVRQMYVIEAAPPGQRVQPEAAGVLRVQRVRVADPFNRQALTRRLPDGTYRTDYYHILLAPPGSLLTAQTQQYLTASGPYPTVIDSASSAVAGYTLEGMVSRLVGVEPVEKSQAGTRAEISVEFFLLDESTGAGDVIFNKTYRESIAIPTQGPGDLVDGWSQGWGAIMKSLAADLAEHAQAARASKEGAAAKSRAGVTR